MMRYTSGGLSTFLGIHRTPLSLAPSLSSSNGCASTNDGVVRGGGDGAGAAATASSGALLTSIPCDGMLAATTAPRASTSTRIAVGPIIVVTTRAAPALSTLAVASRVTSTSGMNALNGAGWAASLNRSATSA